MPERKKKKKFFLITKTHQEKNSISFQILLQTTCGLEYPRLQELARCLCLSEPGTLFLLALYCSSFPGRSSCPKHTLLQKNCNPASSTGNLVEPLDRKSLFRSSHWTFSTLHSEGGCYLSLKSQMQVKITGSIPCLSPRCQNTQTGNST